MFGLCAFGAGDRIPSYPKIFKIGESFGIAFKLGNESSAIRTALKALGIHGHVRIESDGNRAWVYVDGQYFGTFDYTRKTFVD